MGRYWDHEGPQQAEYVKLHEELVPPSGPAETLEGECLRAAGKLHHEFFNNGGGNNVSGALVFLQQNFPEFRPEWWESLAPYVTGTAVDVGEDVYDTCEQIADDVITFVRARNGNYSPSPCDMWSLQVEETGREWAAEEDEPESDSEESFQP